LADLSDEPASEEIGPLRAGLFGLLGQGNLGNDGSLEAVLAYLRAAHPDLNLDAMCTGPNLVSTRYGIPSVPLRWYQSKRQKASGLLDVGGRGLRLGAGLVIDSARTASWVRRHDAVIVPGMGALEATVPMRPWLTPYSIFLLCATGRLFRTKVALISVGTNVIDHRLTRLLVTASARLAYYRSYRDHVSRDAMERMGVDTSSDKVYPDVVYSLPVSAEVQEHIGSVAVGVMDYCGGNDDRARAEDIRSSYIDKMTRFVLWLIDNGRPVRLFTSDAVADEPIVRAILERLRVERPALSPQQLVAEPAFSLDELIRQTASADIVVAARYHNVLYAMLLGKPALSISYAAKCDELMAEMGLSEFSHSARFLDVTRLIEQFTDLERRSEELRQTVRCRCATKAAGVDQQFRELSAVLFPEAEPRTRPKRVQIEPVAVGSASRGTGSYRSGSQ
jgi:polysaccharide pyruvyl transferase WcaK-like protein